MLLVVSRMCKSRFAEPVAKSFLSDSNIIKYGCSAESLGNVVEGCCQAIYIKFDACGFALQTVGGRASRSTTPPTQFIIKNYCKASGKDRAHNS